MAETPRLNVINHSDEPLGLVLEPWGEVYPLPPGAEKLVLYVNASADEYMAVSVEKGYIKVWAEGEGQGTLELGEPDDRRLPQVEDALRKALRSCLADPLDPPSGDLLSAVLSALGDLLYVVWPADEVAAPDGVTLALSERTEERLTISGAVYMLYADGRTYHRLRPLSAELSDAGESTIRVGAATDETDFGPSAEMKFADPSAVTRWEHVFRVSAGDNS